MKIIFKNSEKLMLGYSVLRACGYKYAQNEITEYIDRVVNKRYVKKVDFHHSKLARNMLLIKSLKTFEIKESLTKTDKFDLKFSKKFIPYVKEFYDHEKFASIFKRIELIRQEKIKKNQQLVLPFIDKVSNTWKIKKPNKLIVINNPFIEGGHLYLLKERIILTLNFLNRYENMIRYIFCHEFSHYFQDKLFGTMKHQIESKSYLYKFHPNYSEWKSYFSENLVEAVIFCLILPPPKEIYSKQLEKINKEFCYTKSIVETIIKNNMKQIGKDELKIILDNLDNYPNNPSKTTNNINNNILKYKYGNKSTKRVTSSRLGKGKKKDRKI